MREGQSLCARGKHIPVAASSFLLSPTHSLPICCSLSDPVYFVDTKAAADADAPTPGTARVKPAKNAPPTPLNLAAAEKKLKEKEKTASTEDEPYVYLPPGSSMADPAYGSSMADPIDPAKVYRRDPQPQ